MSLARDEEPSAASSPSSAQSSSCTTIGEHLVGERTGGEAHPVIGAEFGRVHPARGCLAAGLQLAQEDLESLDWERYPSELSWNCTIT